MYKEIKTVTTGATEQAVTFTDEHSYVYAKNIGDTDVYLSALSGIVAGADDVALCAAGDTAQICPVGKTIYVLGASTIEFHATNTDNSPFKSAGKGGGSGDGSTKYIGTTTTALSNGSTTNPITVNGESYTAQFGDIAVYNYTEFIFDGTAWGEFGRQYDSTPTSGSANAVTSAGIYELIHQGTGLGSVRIRNGTTASGDYSTAMGTDTTASGFGATAMGISTTASGTRSTAMGGITTASGNYATAMGGLTTASGACATAMGEKTIADQACMTAMGKYNSPSTGDLFNIGNGTSDNARSNIVEVSSTYLNVNGAIKANGVAIPTAVSLAYTAETEALTLTVS